MVLPIVAVAVPLVELTRALAQVFIQANALLSTLITAFVTQVATGKLAISLAVGIAFFFIGTFNLEPQTRVMIALDQTYEFVLYPYPIEVGSTILYTFTALPYRETVTRVNDFVSYAGGRSKDAWNRFRALIQIEFSGSVGRPFKFVPSQVDWTFLYDFFIGSSGVLTFTNIAETFKIVVDYLLLDLIILPWEEIPSWRLPGLLGDYVSLIIDFLVCVVELWRDVWFALGTITIISESCRFCRYADGLSCSAIGRNINLGAFALEASCPSAGQPFREPFCHTFTDRAVNCTAKVLVNVLPIGIVVTLVGQAVSPGLRAQFNQWVFNIERGVSCMLQLWKKPVFIIIGTFDLALFELTNGAVGRPCLRTPLRVIFAIIGWLAVDRDSIVRCTLRLIDAITLGFVSDFFRQVFNAFFPFIQELVEALEQVIDCFFLSSGITSCYLSYPGGSLMSAIGQPNGIGRCSLTNILPGTSINLLLLLFPEQGMNTCMSQAAECLCEPTPDVDNPGQTSINDILRFSLCFEIAGGVLAADLIFFLPAYLVDAIVCTAVPLVDAAFDNGLPLFQSIIDFATTIANVFSNFGPTSLAGGICGIIQNMIVFLNRINQFVQDATFPGITRPPRFVWLPIFQIVSWILRGFLLFFSFITRVYNGVLSVIKGICDTIERGINKVIGKVPGVSKISLGCDKINSAKIRTCSGMPRIDKRTVDDAPEPPTYVDPATGERMVDLRHRVCRAANATANPECADAGTHRLRYDDFIEIRRAWRRERAHYDDEQRRKRGASPFGTDVDFDAELGPDIGALERAVRASAAYTRARRRAPRYEHAPADQDGHWVFEEADDVRERQRVHRRAVQHLHDILSDRLDAQAHAEFERWVYMRASGELTPPTMHSVLAGLHEFENHMHDAVSEARRKRELVHDDYAPLLEIDDEHERRRAVAASLSERVREAWREQLLEQGVPPPPPPAGAAGAAADPGCAELLWRHPLPLVLNGTESVGGGALAGVRYVFCAAMYGWATHMREESPEHPCQHMGDCLTLSGFVRHALLATHEAVLEDEQHAVRRAAASIELSMREREYDDFHASEGGRASDADRAADAQTTRLMEAVIEVVADPGTLVRGVRARLRARGIPHYRDMRARHARGEPMPFEHAVWVPAAAEEGGNGTAGDANAKRAFEPRAATIGELAPLRRETRLWTSVRSALERFAVEVWRRHGDETAAMLQLAVAEGDVDVALALAEREQARYNDGGYDGYEGGGADGAADDTPVSLRAADMDGELLGMAARSTGSLLALASRYVLQALLYEATRSHWYAASYRFAAQMEQLPTREELDAVAALPDVRAAFDGMERHALYQLRARAVEQLALDGVNELDRAYGGRLPDGTTLADAFALRATEMRALAAGHTAAAAAAGSAVAAAAARDANESHVLATRSAVLGVGMPARAANALEFMQQAAANEHSLAAVIGKQTRVTRFVREHVFGERVLHGEERRRALGVAVRSVRERVEEAAASARYRSRLLSDTAYTLGRAAGVQHVPAAQNAMLAADALAGRVSWEQAQCYGAGQCGYVPGRGVVPLDEWLLAQHEIPHAERGVLYMARRFGVADKLWPGHENVNERWNRAGRVPYRDCVGADGGGGGGACSAAVRDAWRAYRDQIVFADGNQTWHEAHAGVHDRWARRDAEGAAGGGAPPGGEGEEEDDAATLAYLFEAFDPMDWSDGTDAQAALRAARANFSLDDAIRSSYARAHWFREHVGVWALTSDELRAEQIRMPARLNATADGATAATADPRFNANKVMVDYVLQPLVTFVFGGAKNSLTRVFDLMPELVVGDDVLQAVIDFFTVTIPNYFKRVVRCKRPENYDGSRLFSPFCVPFQYEGLFFGWMDPTPPNNVFPLQLAWPTRLVARECRPTATTRNTNDPRSSNNFFQFEFQNSCMFATSTEDGRCLAQCCEQGAQVCDTKQASSLNARPAQQCLRDCCQALSDCQLVPNCGFSDQVEVAPGVRGLGLDCRQSNDNPVCVAGCCEQGAQLCDTRQPDTLLRGDANRCLRFCGNGIPPTGGLCPPETGCPAPPGGVVTNRCIERFEPTGQVAAPVQGVTCNLYPHCPTWGLCERQYIPCVDAGFSDVLDVVLLLTGALPFAVDGLLQGSMSTAQFEDVIMPLLLIMVIFLFFSSTFGIVWVLPIWLFQAYFALTVIWMVQAVFPGATEDRLPIVVPATAFYVIGMNGLGGISKLIRSLGRPVNVYLPMYLFISLAFAVIPVSVPIKQVLNVNGFLVSFTRFFTETFTFVDRLLPLDRLLARFEQFDYQANGGVPGFHVFCAFWVWESLGILLISLGLSPLAPAAARWIGQLALLFLSILNVLWQTIIGVFLYLYGTQLASQQQAIGDVHQRVTALEGQQADAAAAAAAAAEGGGAPPPPPSYTEAPAPRRPGGWYNTLMSVDSTDFVALFDPDASELRRRQHAPRDGEDGSGV